MTLYKYKHTYTQQSINNISKKKMKIIKKKSFINKWLITTINKKFEIKNIFIFFIIFFIFFSNKLYENKERKLKLLIK